MPPYYTSLSVDTGNSIGVLYIWLFGVRTLSKDYFPSYAYCCPFPGCSRVIQKVVGTWYRTESGEIRPKNLNGDGRAGV